MSILALTGIRTPRAYFQAAGWHFSRRNFLHANNVAAGYRPDELLAAITEKTPDGQPIMASFMDIPESFDHGAVVNSMTLAAIKTLEPSFLPLEKSRRFEEKMLEALLKHAAYRQLFSFIQFGGLYSGAKFLNWMKVKLDAGGRDLGRASRKAIT